MLALLLLLIGHLTANNGAAAVVGAVAFADSAAAVEGVGNRHGKHGIGASLRGCIPFPVMYIKMLCCAVRPFFFYEIIFIVLKFHQAVESKCPYQEL